MKIYGHFLSSPANQVRLTASALGIEHDYINVDLAKGAHKAPDYLKINPMGKVPAMDDNGFYLFESGAIARYLASKTNSDLYPQPASKRATIDQWMDVSSCHIRANMSKIMFVKIAAPMMGIEADPKNAQEGAASLDQQLPVIEQQLAQSAYLAGHALTLADLAMLSSIEPLPTLDYDLSAFPKIIAWRDGLMATDWYQNVHAHYMAEAQQ